MTSKKETASIDFDILLEYSGKESSLEDGQ
jgi:hypothetical protein